MKKILFTLLSIPVGLTGTIINSKTQLSVNDDYDYAGLLKKYQETMDQCMWEGEEFDHLFENYFSKKLTSLFYTEDFLFAEKWYETHFGKYIYEDTVGDILLAKQINHWSNPQDSNKFYLDITGVKARMSALIENRTLSPLKFNVRNFWYSDILEFSYIDTKNLEIDFFKLPKRELYNYFPVIDIIFQSANQRSLKYDGQEGDFDPLWTYDWNIVYPIPDQEPSWHFNQWIYTELNLSNYAQYLNVMYSMLDKHLIDIINHTGITSRECELWLIDQIVASTHMWKQTHSVEVIKAYEGVLKDLVEWKKYH